LDPRSDPDDLKSDGVPESRGASSGGTISTTIASGGTDSRELAWKYTRPSARIPTWPIAEIANPLRMKRFNPIILGRVNAAAPSGHHTGYPKSVSVLWAVVCAGALKQTLERPDLDRFRLIAIAVV
jgi:hypothetical protein